MTDVLTDSDRIKVLTTVELLSLRDKCVIDGLDHRISNAVIWRLDAAGKHVLQAHSLHQTASAGFIRARALFKFLGCACESELHVVDVSRDVWDKLTSFVGE